MRHLCFYCDISLFIMSINWNVNCFARCLIVSTVMDMQFNYNRHFVVCV